MTDTRPPPGSPEAQSLGCNCPVFDNHYGRGYWGDGKKYGWVHRVDCLVHRKLESTETVNEKE